MALLDSNLEDAADALAARLPYASTHTGDPSTNGANEGTADRVSVSWTSDSDGDLTATINFTGGGASENADYIGFWSASTSGTWRGFYALTGDTAFNAAGELTVNVTITGTTS